MCSPLLVLPKPNGDLRLTVDYRKLNCFIKPYTFPLTTTEDILSRIGGSTRFTTLDLKTWFWQFELSPEARACTTFVTPTMGAWMWNRLPMGLNISPAICQAKLDEIFRCTYDGPGPCHGMMALGNVINCYMDDVFIHSCDEHHAASVDWCFRRLRAHNVKVELKKTFICRTHVSFLGHILDTDGLHFYPSILLIISP